MLRAVSSRQPLWKEFSVLQSCAYLVYAPETAWQPYLCWRHYPWASHSIPGPTIFQGFPETGSHLLPGCNLTPSGHSVAFHPVDLVLPFPPKRAQHEGPCSLPSFFSGTWSTHGFTLWSDIPVDLSVGSSNTHSSSPYFVRDSYRCP